MDMKISTVLSIILLLLMLGVPALGGEVADSFEGKSLLIDVRTLDEWNAGHLQGAILIPYERIGAEISAVTTDKKTKINLYCRSGRRSGIGLESLKQLGYEDVTNLGSLENAAKILGRPIVK